LFLFVPRIQFENGMKWTSVLRPGFGHAQDVGAYIGLEDFAGGVGSHVCAHKTAALPTSSGDASGEKLPSA
jgi:hypothetical protein